MSGGHFGYVEEQLKVEIFGLSSKPQNEFEDVEISELVWDVLNLIHVFDYYVCSDYSEEDYLKAKQNFKNKWFYGNNEERTTRIIDETIEAAKQELYKTFCNKKRKSESGD